jgi:hypothetical protein
VPTKTARRWRFTHIIGAEFVSTRYSGTRGLDDVVVRVVNESERSATDLRVRDQDGKEVTHESALTAYSVETTEIGGSTLYTIKWTGLQPTEAGWSPPSDTLCN